MGYSSQKSRDIKKLPVKRPIVILHFLIRFSAFTTLKDIFFFKNCKARKYSRWGTAGAPGCAGVPATVLLACGPGVLLRP
jgi:hypothetical protein